MDKTIFQKSFNKIKTLDCRNFKLINLTNLNTDIYRIYLYNVYLREIELHYFKNLKKLYFLSITYNSVNTIRNYTFIDLNELVYLVLQNNYITHIECGAFSGLYYLAYLDINYNAILGLHTDTFKIMNRLGNILAKNISFINLSESKLKVIKSRLFIFDKMESIDLSYNQITTLENNTFSIIFINYIYLEGNMLSSIDEYVFHNININLLLSIFENIITCNCDLHWIVKHEKMLGHLNNEENANIECNNDTQLLKDYVENSTCISTKGIYI